MSKSTISTFDLFDQGSDSQPGGRQTDLEMLIEEKAMNPYEQKQEARRERLLPAPLKRLPAHGPDHGFIARTRKTIEEMS